MKKFICVIIVFLSLLFLTGCQGYDISKMLFIASVGIEEEENTLVGYFYLPLSSDIGKTETNENTGQGDYAKIKGKTIPELFFNLQNSTTFIVNYHHVSSIVIDEDLMQADFLEQLMDYIKFSLDIDFNCYLFVTKEKMEELYDFKNPNRESVLNSILVSTSDVSNLFLLVQPIHFLEFVQKYYNNRSIILPLLDLAEIWTIEGETSKNFYAQSAIYYYQNNTKEVVKNESSPYFSKSTNFIDHLDEITLSFTNYKFKTEYKDILHINVEFSCECYKSFEKPSEENIIAFVYQRIRNYIEEFKDIDPLDLNYFNLIYHTNCNYDVMNIQINIRKN